MTNTNGIIKTVERKGELLQAKPKRYVALRAAAENLSRRNVDQAVCELLNEALARLVQIVYEQDAGGLCNVDAATGKLLIPLPWGRLGHARWGLRPSEGIILRQVMFDWQQEPKPLFHYDTSRRAWLVDLYTYANHHLAKQWLAKYQVTVATYRLAREKKLG